MKRMNLSLDDATHRNLKAIAALKDFTIAGLIQYFVDREINEKPDECELCKKYGHVPNAETIKALEDDSGKTFSSVEAYFKDLEKDGIKKPKSKK